MDSARLLVCTTLNDGRGGFTDFKCINSPGLPLSDTYVLEKPTLTLHTTTIMWLGKLLEASCFKGWAVHCDEGKNKDLGDNRIEFKVIIVTKNATEIATENAPIEEWEQV